MTEGVIDPILLVNEPTTLFGGKNASVRLDRGLAILVGPNGSGKTRSLRSLKQGLHTLINPLGKKVRFLAAGRSAPLEPFRSAVNYPGNINTDVIHIGGATYKPQWFDYESVTGDFLALDQRPDLLLKVQARLQTFLSRSLQLSWSQAGLELRLQSSVGTNYPANAEASGILHLVPLLASIYHDDVGALLIDEPEISLHPQYQAFIRDELFAIAGDPRCTPEKKFIVLATHSPIMLNLRQAGDLSKIVFFGSNSEIPRQLPPQAPELKRRKLAALVSRLSATHRLAFFAQNVLLVEGASDEIILEQLAASQQIPLMAANTQIVPVNGKGEIVEAAKLFELTGKRVTVLADLDGLVDNNALVNHFGQRTEAVHAAEAAGHQNLRTLDRTLRAELSQMVTDHWSAVEDIASKHSYWADVPEEKRDDLAKKRALLATLLNSPAALNRRIPRAGFLSLQKRFNMLIELLAVAGCVILRKGAIEAYFAHPTDLETKVESAAIEAMAFAASDSVKLEAKYPEATIALKHASQRSRVDENTMLRTRLGAMIGAAFQALEQSTENDVINAIVADILGRDAAIFQLQNASTETERRLKITIASPLFKREKFPIEISINDNPAMVLSQLLPSTA